MTEALLTPALATPEPAASALSTPVLRRRMEAMTLDLRRAAARSADAADWILYETAAETLAGLAKAFRAAEDRAPSPPPATPTWWSLAQRILP